MNYITILTPDNIEIKYRLAGVGSRIGAVCIDLIAQGLVLVIFAVICFYTLLGGSFNLIDTWNDTAWVISFIIIVVFIIIFGYYIAAEIIFNGQTPGKKLLGLRVIRDNGAPIGLVQSLIRNLIKLFIDIFGVGVLMVFFNKKSKRLGDMAAGTIVIACDARQINIDIDSFYLMKNEYKPAGVNNKLIISQADKRLLNDYFAEKDTYTDGGQSVREAFAGYFSKIFGVPASEFTEPVLRWILENN